MSAVLPIGRPVAPVDVRQLAQGVTGAVSSLLAGRAEQIELATACILAGGHLLIEDIPGVGKTLLAQGLAAALGGSFSRVQGTADLLPSDVVGALSPNADGLGLHFRPGPIFANVVLFDELNRVNARTQSALLEVLEEGHVTVDGVEHPVPQPFTLIATQNPVEMAGTYALAEGVSDRFIAAFSLGRANAEEEVEVLTGRRGRARLADVVAVAAPEQIVAARAEVARVHLHDTVARYAVDVLNATRDHPRVHLGASTRAGVGTIALAKAFAAIDGRDYVSPGDVARAARRSLAHRLVVAGADRRVVAELVEECVSTVPAPRR